MAVESFASVAAEFPNARLTMIGPDKRDGSLENTKTRLIELGLLDAVRITGAIPKAEIPTWLKQSDIFINTTNYESFGVSVMEAAASGLCIVSTSVGELPKLWSHGEEALLVPPGDHHRMAEGIRRILTEPALAAQLSRKARTKAEGFDWPVLLPQWGALLAKVVNGANRRIP